ncbi:hypothetical protein [Frigidibacter oleivorans]|uniref:hypothetical protein n=1 Tax=Frigidibacter oleivorans TaxID=2487129 RepID=UPI000F8EA735|nr:hypothetical protein [Frigidibacter oleivorans]
MVTTIKLTPFLAYILPRAPGCPDPVALFQTRLAAIEFCERTRCWRHMVEAALNEQGQAIVAPPGSAIHEIEDATLDGRPLDPTQITDLAHDGVAQTPMTGQAKYLTQVTPDTVSVYPFEPGVLRLSLFLKPRHGQSFGGDPDDPLDDANNRAPDFLLTQHGETIAAGALSRILSIPGQLWTDAKAATAFRAVFDEAMRGAFSSKIRGQQRAPVRTKPRWL